MTKQERIGARIAHFAVHAIWLPEGVRERLAYVGLALRFHSRDVTAGMTLFQGQRRLLLGGPRITIRLREHLREQG